MAEADLMHDVYARLGAQWFTRHFERQAVVTRKRGRRLPGRLRLLRLYVWRYLEELERCEQAMTPQQRATHVSMLMREWP